MSIEDNMSLEGITKRQQQICETALKEKRGFTPEEEKEMDHWDEVYKRNHESLNNGAIRPVPFGQSQKIEAEARRKKSMNTENTMFGRDGYRWNPEGTSLRDSYNKYIAFGPDALTPAEFRGLQGDKDTSGGYMITPVEVSRQIYHDLDNELFVRQLATRIMVEHAETFRVPRLDGDFGNPTWSAELGTGSEDASMDFEATQFTPRPLARRIRISLDLLRIAGPMNPEDFVRQRIVQVVGQVLEAAYLTGTAPGPMGLFTASDSGISTARDVTASSTTEVKFDDLISAIGKLKYQWRKNACWICHRDIETQLRKLKTGDGIPIIENSIDGKTPPRLLGFPVFVSEYAPSTTGSGNYAMVLGDLKYYYVIDAMNIQITRLVELYAATNELGLIVRYSGDANVISENAFVRIRF